jgi:lysophospholipase L1-like esterase
MHADLAKLFATLIALAGAPPADAPKELQLKPGDQIVAIGDSITQGANNKERTGYLDDINSVLASQYPDLKLPKVINVGISGQKAEDLIKRFKKDVVDKKPQWVTISIGINDVWHRLNAAHDPAVLAMYTDNVSKMVDMAQAAGIKVILLSPTVIQENAAEEGNKRLAAYVAAERKIADEKKCQFVNLHQMFLTVLAKKPAGEGDKWLTRDGVHMKPVGDALMALGALRALGVPDAKIAAGAEK